MSTRDYSLVCETFVSRYLKRKRVAADGIPEREVRKAEAQLGVQLPTSLRSFYLAVGAVPQLCSIHNVVHAPKELIIEDGYLLFMEENQSVVSWGIKVNSLTKDNPRVWQRNNSSGVWYPEGKSVTALLRSMFDWYEQLGVWNPKR